jgi:multimeric flavodoxin WrbA
MKALLLIGSPRKAKSVSETLSAYLLEQLEARGVATDKRYVHSALKSEGATEDLVGAVAAADLVILAAPLYVDSLPAPVIRLLEILARRLGDHERPAGQRFMALVNCGFPEAHHNDVALAIYRRFAREAGFAWVGGLGLGAGEAFKGRALAQSGGMARNVIAALDLAAEALVGGQPLPPEAGALMARPTIPAGIYRIMGGLGWWLQARPHGTQWKLSRKVWRSAEGR